jgi:hypothetical protein
VLRIFRHKRERERERVTGGCRILCDDCKVITSERMRYSENVARMREKRDAHRTLRRKPKAKKAPGRPWYRRKKNIKTDSK